MSAMRIELEGFFMITILLRKDFAGSEALTEIRVSIAGLSTTFFLEDHTLISSFILEDLTLTSSFLRSTNRDSISQPLTFFLEAPRLTSNFSVR